MEQQSPVAEPINWHRNGHIPWAYSDGLLIALVERPEDVNEAVHLVRSRLRAVRRRAPGAYGELILNGSCDWSTPFSTEDDRRVVDFDRLAAVFRLSANHIALAVSESGDLEGLGQQHFSDHRSALEWVRARVGDRFRPQS